MNPRLKHLIRSAIVGTGMHRVLAAGLNGLRLGVLPANRFVSYLYGRAWPVLDQNYYDQRFNCLRGPAAWAWAERGMFAYFALRPEDRVLDLCCGEGIYPGLFVAPYAARVDAVDRDPCAIAAARRRYRRPNLRFHCLDILVEPFPQPPYDLVTCFASLQYFDDAQCQRLLRKIRQDLTPAHGRFLGSVPLLPRERPDPYAARSFHELDTLARALAPHFEHVDLREYRAGAWPYAYFTARTCSSPGP